LLQEQTRRALFYEIELTHGTGHPQCPSRRRESSRNSYEEKVTPQQPTADRKLAKPKASRQDTRGADFLRDGETHRWSMDSTEILIRPVSGSLRVDSAAGEMLAVIRKYSQRALRTRSCRHRIETVLVMKAAENRLGDHAVAGAN